MARKKILFVNMMVPAGDGPSPQYTGEWRDGYELSIALVRKGFEVTLLSPSIGKHETVVRNEIDSVACSEGVKLQYAGFVLNRRIGNYMTIRMTLAWLLKYIMIKPDLLIFKQARPDIGLLIPGIRKRTLVLTCDLTNHAIVPQAPKENNTLIYHKPKRFQSFLNDIFNWILWPLAVWKPIIQQYQYVGLLIAPSQKHLDSIKSFNSKKQTVVNIPKGFLSYPDRVWKGKDLFCTVDVLFCGVIGLNKGVFETIEAWRQLSIYANLGIIGIGIPSMQEKLNSMISNLKGVHYFGGVGYFEKFALFNKAKLLVLPSKSDYFPSVIFEAFSSGLPVITTSLIASPVIHNENGLILDSKDISGLTKSIEYLLTNESERKRMAECAKKVSSEYSWDKAVRQISLLLR